MGSLLSTLTPSGGRRLDLGLPGGVRRLRAYVQLNLFALLLAIAWVAVARLWLVPSRWVDVILVLLSAMAVALVIAIRMATVYRHVGTLVILSVSNWVIIIAMTAIVPYAFTILPLIILLPAFLAVPYLPRRQLAIVFGATIAASTATAVAGRLQPGVGIDTLIPGWLQDALVVVFIPVSSGLVSFLAWLNHVALSAQADALRESRVRLVAAGDRERRRIERDLHDGAQQRLVAAAMQLRAVQRLVSGAPQQAHEVIDQMADDLRQASVDLRDLAHGIFPAELTDHGLYAALSAVARRSPLPSTVSAEDVGRYPPDVEASVYFCCLEALQNATKHAGDRAVVTISLRGGDGLSFAVDDTGVGCDPVVLRTGHGYTNMSDRISAVGGSLTAHATPGGGVHLHGHIPGPGVRSAPFGGSSAGRIGRREDSIPGHG